MQNYSNHHQSFQWLGLDESDLAHLLRKHWRLFVWVPVAAAVALVYCLLATPFYRTSALLYLQPNFDQDFHLEQSGSTKLEDEDSLRSIEKAVISDTVILRMIERLHLREDPEYLLADLKDKKPLSDSELLQLVRKRYKAELLPTTRVLKLTVSDPSAERASVIANTLTEEFLGGLRGELNREGAALRESLTTQGARALEEALKSEGALQEFRMKNPGFLVEQDSDVFQERVLQYGRELNEARAMVARLKGTVEALIAVDPEESPFQVFEIVGTRDNQSVNELLKLCTTAEAELAVAKEVYGVKNPKYRIAEQSLGQAQRSLRNYAAQSKESAMSDFTASLKKAEQLEDSLKQIQGEFAGFKSKSAEFRGLKVEVEKNWSVHSEIQKKILNLTLNPQVFPMFAIPLSEPVVPHKAFFPSKLMFMGGGMVVSTILVLAYLLWLHRHGLPFTRASQLESLVGVPVIGVIDRSKGVLASGRQPGLVTQGKPGGLPVALAPYRTVHFTSLAREHDLNWLPASVGEAFSRSGSKTLLVNVKDGMPVDVDLEGGNPLLEWRKPDTISTTDLITFELPVSALIQREQFRKFLRGVLEDFDRVVFDGTDLVEREAIFAITQEVESNVLVVAEAGILRPEAAHFVERMVAESAAKSISGVYLKLQESQNTPRKKTPQAAGVGNAKVPGWSSPELCGYQPLEANELGNAG